MVYRAVSKIPRLDPEILRRDQVDPLDLDNLILPPISDRTAALAESIVEGSSSDFEKAARLEEFLLRNYDYDLRVEPLAESFDVVDNFLFNRQAGYCSRTRMIFAALR